MPAVNHVHSYQKLTTKRWRCTDPYCTHTISREMVLGKASICKCGAEFILDYESLRRRNPTCFKCSNTKEAKKHRRAQLIISQVLHEQAALYIKKDENGNIIDSPLD